MLKKQITYREIGTNKEITDTFYFNLTDWEVMEINLMEDIESVGKSDNPRAIIPVMKRVIRAAAGKNIAGEWAKPENYGDWFIASDAFSKLILEILNSENAEEMMSAFITNIVPPDMALRVKQQQEAKAAEQEAAEEVLDGFAVKPAQRVLVDSTE